MLGLVDGNNFYASCERAFDPRLIGRPVVVASNNDGCAIARSAEAKALGIKMGQPLHEITPEVRRKTVIRSANFGLYGDLSGRIVDVLRTMFPRVEVYSIDESFIEFPAVGDRVEAAFEARHRIQKWTGIPCCVGIGPTKTLAKMANKLAKSGDSVVDLADEQVRTHHMRRFPVEDLWGVGRKWAARLGSDGILSALDLVNADPDTLRSRYGVILSRTQRELQGIPCADLEEIEPDRKQIIVSRSFGKECTDVEELAESVSTFAIRACEKLRLRKLECGGVWVWMNTNPFKPSAPQYHPSKTFALVKASSDTREIVMVARGLARAMYRSGYRYKKAGVGLIELTASSAAQADLFSQVDPRATAMMDAMDSINKKFGRGTMGLAASGWRKAPTWQMNRKSLSPAYTSRWDQLLRVR